MTIAIHIGDCLDVLRGMPDASVDSVVTDPPYGLSFMGKTWDYDVPSVEIWAECLRVLKPGGHLLAFAGTRTQHRMAVRIEDAGFEIRDMIAWVYGSGFPKSLDVSKAIDKQRKEDIEPIRAVCRVVRAAMDAKGILSKHLVDEFNGCHPRLIDHWAARDTDSQPSLPTWEQWQTLRRVLNIDDAYDAEVWRLNGRKGLPGDAWQHAEIVGEHGGSTPGFGDHRFAVRDNKIRAATDAARQWQGWGTALKPALEPITVARKPLAGTVAENVLQWGVGGLNIDGCRVATEETLGRFNNARTSGTSYVVQREAGLVDNSGGLGRWPANLIHDGSGDVLAGFPETGASRVQVRNQQARPSQKAKGAEKARVGVMGHDDEGGSAARFFYCAKASKADRGAENNHPTVKPTDLMRYLCRLVTPPGGVVLDPFMGSGSTGKAAHLEQFSFIGIEIDPKWEAIARARITGDAPLFAEVTA